jgi:hypothetical protein
MKFRIDFIRKIIGDAIRIYLSDSVQSVKQLNESILPNFGFNILV